MHDDCIFAAGQLLHLKLPAGLDLVAHGQAGVVAELVRPA